MIEGPDEFAFIRDVIAGRTSADQAKCAEPTFERLRRAIQNVGGRSAVDRAVLLRHALRYESGRRGELQPSPRLDLPAGTEVWPALQQWDAVGIKPQVTSSTIQVTALPWQPSWLPGSDKWPADRTAATAPVRRFAPGAEIAGDPFLPALGHENYRSIGQRAAIRAALSMPPGSVLAVDLPTGEGKSTIFTAIAKIGFSSSPYDLPIGVTLVTVPTVTLALDHQNSARRHFPDRPLAYVGGRDDDNKEIISAIRSGTQGLCFASPEAICGPLRFALSDAARANQLRALVVDEAHLVDGWGTGFRTEFQLLSGIRRQLLELCPDDRPFRTVLLSATMSEAARGTLQTLFASPQRLHSVSGAMVRPEPEFWVADAAEEETRNQRVEEALFNLPRPAILYVTTRKDAEQWRSRLCDLGYQSVAMLHGETGAQDRDAVLDRWRLGDLDLVVGTSAFGLGIDYPHVRTIVHACLPETFDRYYQEVGRSGRDGRAAVSILLPAHRNVDEAEGLNRQKVIGFSRGFDRWQAMFSHEDRRDRGFPYYDLRLDISPGVAPERLDMLSERSTDWNARLLTLMARAGMIELQGIPEAPAADGAFDSRVFQTIKILDSQHLDPDHWNSLIQPLREAIASANSKSLYLMKRFLTGAECPGHLVAELYRNVAHCCPGCAACREDPGFARGMGMVVDAPPPWPVIGPPDTALRLNSLPMLIMYPQVAPDRAVRRRWRDAVGQLDRFGLRVCITVGEAPEWLIEGIRAATKARPWFIEHARPDRQLPQGPRLLVHGTRDLPSPEDLQVGQWPKLVLIPDGATDPSRPHRRLSDVVRPALTFDDFVRTLNG